MPTDAKLVEAPASFPIKVADWLERLADNIRNRKPKPGLGGQVLDFKLSGAKLGKPVYSIISKRGKFSVGRIEWSNQWRTPRAVLEEGVDLNKQCVAEIHAMLRDYR